MENYIKEIIERKYRELRVEEEILCSDKNLVMMKKSNTFLSELQEMIVKAIYLSGGLFQNDIKRFFQFSADKSKVERNIQLLIKDGYIYFKRTKIGNLYGLTREGITYMKYEAKDIKEGKKCSYAMKIDPENALTKRRIISAKIGEYVFQTELRMLWDYFYGLDKYKRNEYVMRQYIKNIYYREYLLMEERERRKHLSFICYPSDEVEEDIAVKGYSYVIVEKYVEAYLRNRGFKEIRNTRGYRKYIMYIKANCLSEPNDNTFSLLKDLWNGLKKTPYIEINILRQWESNLIRFGDKRIRCILENHLEDNERIIEEGNIEMINRYIMWLNNERKGLISTNVYKKSDNESELKKVNKRIALLEEALETMKKKKDEWEAGFSFQILKSYTEEGNSYEERKLSIEKLTKNGIYITGFEGEGIKGILRVSVIQQREEYFDVFLLHKKVAMTFQLLHYLFPLYIIEIEIATYTEEQRNFVLSKLDILKGKLSSSRNTALLASLMDDNLSVIQTAHEIEERYKFYSRLGKAIGKDKLENE